MTGVQTCALPIYADADRVPKVRREIPEPCERLRRQLVSSPGENLKTVEVTEQRFGPSDRADYSLSVSSANLAPDPVAMRARERLFGIRV